MAELLRVETSDGKYTVILSEEKGLYALRHSEHWRDLTGDKLILALAQEIEGLRKTLRDLEMELEWSVDGG